MNERDYICKSTCKRAGRGRGPRPQPTPLPIRFAVEPGGRPLLEVLGEEAIDEVVVRRAVGCGSFDTPRAHAIFS